MEFKNGSTASVKYTYDKNGNLTQDLNKGIRKIAYNSRNLPERIEFTNTKMIHYTYDAAGTKRRVVHQNGSDTPMKQYCENKVYDGTTLTMILHETGYLSKENGTWKYFYYLKDHVGSNRLVLDDQGGVVQINNYYPYGLTQAEPTPRTDQAEQPYKFGGKELDRDFGVDAYDFEARMYNPAIGRFMQPDPLAEKYYSISPYAYCANNPVRYIDPDGRDYWSTNDIELIKQFLNSLGSGATQHDFSGWQHATDAQFTGNLTYNDKTGKFYTSYTTIENGEITVVGKSFDANLTPVSSDGYGYPGAFVYEYENETWSPLFSFAYDITPFSSFISPIDPSRYGPWSVNSSGRITGIAPITGMPPAVGRGGLFRGGKFTQKMGKAKGNMTGNRAVQNQQAKAIANELGLNAKEQEQLHRLIGGQGYNYQEALMEAKTFFNK